MASSILSLISWKAAAGSSNWISRKDAAGSSICVSGTGSSNWKAAARSSIWISGKDVAGSSNWISRKAAAGSSLWISRKVASESPNLLGGCGARMSTMSISDESVLCPSSLPSKISPWLMLPPAFEQGGNLVYKFYSLAENKVLSLSKRGGGKRGDDAKLAGPSHDWLVALFEKLESPEDDARLVGSSHGWLALCNEKNNDLFLSNPLSRRHLQLPFVHTLPDPEGYGRPDFERVSKVIISCSPDEEECRAMMIYGSTNRLAFCCPGRSTEWTHIGTLVYKAFVYSSRQKLFFCVSTFNEFEAWDLRDPQSPTMIPMVVSVDRENFEAWDLWEPRSPRITPADTLWDGGLYPSVARSEDEFDLKMSCWPQIFLVVAEQSQSDQLFVVTRHIMQQIGGDGSYVDDPFDDSYPYKTIGFDVHRYDPEDVILRYMDGSFDGLALFIGFNHGFALSAAEFPELKPNTIYFTDICSPPDWADSMYGGHDVGIFSYEHATVSPCYYPCDVKSIKRIAPPPLWFTPSPH
ncbi:hypothetical protein Pfo_024164 [Paulownia fortunei]|nr:hypothetical protein Pfo_024164 [Paulownia fortunei]